MDDSRDQHFHQIKNDANRLAESIKTYLYNEGADQRERWENVSEAAKEKWQEASQVMREKSKQIDEYAREHTWQTAAIAAGIGALVGMLLSRSWKR